MQSHKTTLENGMRIITVPMEGNPTATVLVLVEAGSKYEVAENSGISHFLEHMAFKGTTSHTGKELMRELDGLGAQTNAFTWLEYTGYYAKGQAKHVSKMLEIVSDIYLNSTLPAEEMEKEKGVIIGEIDMYEDMPSRDSVEQFMRLLYGDQPAGWPVLGPKENIKNFTRDHFVSYREAQYVASATTVIISGGIDQEKILAEVKEKFAGISTLPKHEKLAIIENQEKPQIKLKYRNQKFLF